jgi:hypothetical protein
MGVRDLLARLVRDDDGPLTEELARGPGRFGLGQVPRRLAPDAVTSMVCGFCSTGCSLDVHIKDGRAVNLTPTADYPVNRGSACPKGWDAVSMKSLLFVLAMLSAAHADSPVSVPWSLRPVAAASAIRIDTAIGEFTDNGVAGQTITSVWTLSYKITPHLAPLVRFAITDNLPAMGAKAAAISNPLFGLVCAHALPKLSDH